MEIFAMHCPWYVEGSMIGLLIVGLLWAVNKPLGALCSYVDAVEWAQEPATGPSWRDRP